MRQSNYLSMLNMMGAFGFLESVALVIKDAKCSSLIG
uniref:Uncharacterized protein n=1 Tax=Tetranychus urticae TaxID=32264 RepID=T1K165_TETUR